MSRAIIYSVGGTVQASGGIYIPRQADQELLQLCLNGVFAYVLTSRQVGKSSLMVETAIQLREAGIHTVIIDLNAIGSPEKADQWYITQLTKICDHFDLDLDAAAWWHRRPDLAVTDRLIRFYKDVLLAQISGKVVIFVDEIDETIKLPYANDFYAAIRYLYNARANEPELRRLSFVLIGSAAPSDLINDPKRTPFNIGQRVDLTDFTLEEAEPLAAGFGLPAETARQLLQWSMHWTGGHPYLTQRLCSAIAAAKRETWNKKEVEEVVTRTFFGKQGEKDHNLDFVRSMLTERAPDRLAVLTMYREILGHPHRVRDEEQSRIIAHLKLSGVVRSENHKLRVRNAIYEKVFNRQWIREHLPIKWWKTVPRYVWAGAAFIVILLGINVLFVQKRAQQERRLAEAARQSAEQAKKLAEEEKSRFEERQKSREENLNLRLANLARDLTPQVFDALKKDNDDVAALLARQAYLFNRSTKSQRNTEVYEALQAVLRQPYFSAVIEQVDFGVNAVAFSPDNQRLVAGGTNGAVRLWNFSSRTAASRELGRHGRAVVAVAFHPADQTLASGSQDGEIRLWNGKNLYQNYALLPEKMPGLSSLCWSATVRMLAAGDTTGFVQVWDLSQPKTKIIFKAKPGGKINALAFSPDGNTLATTGTDGVIRFWELKKSSFEFKFRFEYKKNLNALAFGAGGPFLVSGSADASVQLWNFHQKRDEPYLFSLNDRYQITTVAFSPKAQLFAAGNSDGAIRIWDPVRAVLLTELKAHEKIVKSLAFSADGNYLASGSWDGTVRFCTIPQPRDTTAILQRHAARVKAVAFNPKNEKFASGDEDNKVLLWDMRQLAAEPLALSDQKSRVRVLAFSPDGRFLASGSDEEAKVRVWKMDKPKADPLVLKDQPEPVYSLAFSPNSKILVTGGNRGTLRFWETGTFKPLPTLTFEHEKNATIRSLAFTPDGKRLVSAGSDGSIRLWDCSQRKKIQQAAADGVSAIAIHPDGAQLASGDDGGKVQLWSLPDLTPMKVLSNDGVSIKFLAFSPDKKIFAAASAGDEAVIRLWDLSRADDPIVLRGHRGGISAIAFSADGGTLISGSEDKTVRLWPARLDMMANQICRKVWRNLTRQQWRTITGNDDRIRYQATCKDLSAEADNRTDGKATN